MAFATRCRTNVVEILQSSTLQGVQYAQSHKSSFQYFDNPYWTLYNILHDSRQKYLPLHSCKNLLLNSTPSIICKMRQIVWKQLNPYQNENRAFLLPTRSNMYIFKTVFPHPLFQELTHILSRFIRIVQSYKFGFFKRG